MKKPKPQLMWACVNRSSGNIWSVNLHKDCAERADLSMEDVRRVEVRVVARKRKRRKP